MFFPPLDLHDSVQQLCHLVHSSSLDKGIRPVDRLISKKDAQFVDLSYFDYLRLLHFAQVVDEVSRRRRPVVGGH